MLLAKLQPIKMSRCNRIAKLQRQGTVSDEGSI